jgi:hypothetical protein
MSCILRVGGTDFDVDGFIASSELEPYSSWRKGEQRFATSTDITDINKSSGIRIVASDADMSNLADQIDETISFLRERQGELTTLAAMPGVDYAVLDFGCEIRPPGWSSFTFPPELLALAGTAGISLCVSVYPRNDDEDDEDDGDSQA